MKVFNLLEPRKLTAFLLAAVLAGTSALSGCSIRRPDPAPGQAESQTDPSESSSYEQYQEDSLKEQSEFDELMEEIFRESVTSSLTTLHFTLSDPSAYGITDYACTFGDYSLASIRENLLEMKAIRTQLDSFQTSLLTEDQVLTLDILKSYLDTSLELEGLELYSTALMPYTGVQAELPVVLAEYTFYTRQDIDDYLQLLADTDEYFDQILAFEQERSKAGLFFSDSAVDHIIESCQPYMIDPEYHFLHTSFISRLEEFPDLTEEEKNDYIQQELTILSEHFIPAYENLAAGLSALKGTGKYEGGLSNYPNGQKYYEYLVRSCTGTSYASMNELKNAIEKNMNNDLAAMSAIITQRPEAVDELETAAFSPTDPVEIIEALKVQITDDFPEIPEHTYTIKRVDPELHDILSPAIYIVPPIDRYDENTVYLNLDDDPSVFQSLFTTLAHESYPGHLYQNCYFYSTDPAPIRCIMNFGGYSEGWGLYVESLSYRFDNGMKSDVAELLMYNSSATIALDALLDLNINYNGWTRDQVYEYLSHYYDVENSDIVDQLYNLLTENPGYYMQYYVGRMEFLEMRADAKDSLGDQFNAKEFHRFLLDIGPAPFSVIRSRFDAWLLAQKIN